MMSVRKMLDMLTLRQLKNDERGGTPAQTHNDPHQRRAADD
jgi:hypothetical protein